MIAYEVTLDVIPSRAEELERYMREDHIPDIRSTGCFKVIRFERAGTGRYRTRYLAGTRADLDRYLKEYAPALREEFRQVFGTDAISTREVWDELETWMAV